MTLLNISRGGALLEVGARYSMRAFVRLKIARTSGETTVVPGTVSWARVGTITGAGIQYLVAVIFERPIDLETVTGWRPDESTADTPQAIDTPHAVPAAAPHELLTSLPAPEPPIAGTITGATAPSPKARVEDLRHELDAATTDLANLTIANEALTANVEASTLELAVLREEAEATRQRAERERARMSQDVLEATATVHTLQATIEREQQEHARALADQQTRYEAIVAELTSAAGAHEAQCASLLAERQSWKDEQTRRTERHWPRGLTRCGRSSTGGSRSMRRRTRRSRHTTRRSSQN